MACFFGATLYMSTSEAVLKSCTSERWLDGGDSILVRRGAAGASCSRWRRYCVKADETSLAHCGSVAWVADYDVTDNIQREWQWQWRVVRTNRVKIVQYHSLAWLLFNWMLTTACCLVGRLRLGLLRFNVWLLCGYAHVFIIFCVVIVLRSSPRASFSRHQSKEPVRLTKAWHSQVASAFSSRCQLWSVYRAKNVNWVEWVFQRTASLFWERGEGGGREGCCNRHHTTLLQHLTWWLTWTPDRPAHLTSARQPKLPLVIHE